MLRIAEDRNWDTIFSTRKILDRYVAIRKNGDDLFPPEVKILWGRVAIVAISVLAGLFLIYKVAH